MGLVESIRNGKENLINVNPALVTITRTAKVSDGAGGYTESTSTLSAQTVRIYSKQSRTLNVDDGGWHSERVVRMIAKHDADINPKSATNTDTFTYGGKTYEVQDVKDRVILGSTVYKECELKEL